MQIAQFQVIVHICFYVTLLYGSSSSNSSITVNGIKSTINSKNKARIVGGIATTIERAPFVVAIYAYRQFICGGSLIRKDMVLTAAHCVRGLSTRAVVVKGGVTNLSDRGVQRSLEKIYLPKEYNSRTYHMDVAVLKLNRQMNGSIIETIELCNKTLKLGQTINVYGWGQLRENSIGNVNTLRSVTLPLITRQHCKRLYKSDKAITSTMFCAGDLKGKDSCSGDSGGPAVYDGELCGIVSWGVGCARPNYPGVYTKINNVRTFLTKAMEM